MTLLSPLLLVALLALPALWWLVRATPPAPKDQTFPSLLLLNRLSAHRQDAARSPLWLLLLRLAAAALIILGLARPIFHPPATETSSRPLLLILDDGWAAIPHWQERLSAAIALGQTAIREHQPVTVFRSSRSPDGAFPEPFIATDAQTLSNFLTHLHPNPWPTDRQALAQTLSARNLSSQHTVLLSDGLTSGHEDALRSMLSRSASLQDMRWNPCDILSLTSHPSEDGTLLATADTPHCPNRPITIRAVTTNGGTLATFSTRTGHPQPITLPPALRNQLDHLSIAGQSSPATTVLLGQAGRRRPVGLLQTPGASTPLTGSAFFLTHALDTLAERRTGDANTLLASPLSVLIATDGALSGDETRHRVEEWIHHGGMLIRFAGPGLAADHPTTPPDPFLPVPLMNGLRQLGGPMSWGKPQTLDAFPPNSPFSGLKIPADITISRQVLAAPGPDLQEHVWAALKDGTPLVTARQDGNGEVVLFHITPSSDWSNLPMSGLFPQMLERLIQRSAGITGGGPDTLPPWRTLDQNATLTTPPAAARPIPAEAIAGTTVSVHNPAGLYGPAQGTRALNLSDNMPPLKEEPLLGTPITPDGARPDTPIGPFLLATGLLFLLADLFLSLRRRGLLGPIAIALFLTLPSGQAADKTADPLPTTSPPAALETRLAYVLTSHDDIDTASREGLQGLSAFTTSRSSVTLGAPDGVIPGRDDLAFYPLLYWPITADAQPDPARTKALNAFMEHGGILLIDQQGAGTEIGATSANTIRAALKRVTDGLSVPPLAELTEKHVLGHTFYLLHNGFPGRINNQPVYVARNGDESNDDVSPILIGNADWAHAWAADPSGNHPYAVLPGGEDQRTQAYRFGMNLVVYALTGNYKNDQAHYPDMLRRLGQPTPDDAPSSTPDSEEDEP